MTKAFLFTKEAFARRMAVSSFFVGNFLGLTKVGTPCVQGLFGGFTLVRYCKEIQKIYIMSME